jgi:hypothetical protein
MAAMQIVNRMLDNEEDIRFCGSNSGYLNISGNEQDRNYMQLFEDTTTDFCE